MKVHGSQRPDRTKEPDVIPFRHGDVDVSNRLDAVPRRISSRIDVTHESPEFFGVMLDVRGNEGLHAQRSHEIQDFQDVGRPVPRRRRQREHHHALAVRVLDQLVGEVPGGIGVLRRRREQRLHFIHDQHAASPPHAKVLGTRRMRETRRSFLRFSE